MRQKVWVIPKKEWRNTIIPVPTELIEADTLNSNNRACDLYFIPDLNTSKQDVRSIAFGHPVSRMKTRFERPAKITFRSF